jgi:hypothetical protein
LWRWLIKLFPPWFFCSSALINVTQLNIERSFSYRSQQAIWMSRGGSRNLQTSLQYSSQTCGRSWSLTLDPNPSARL